MKAIWKGTVIAESDDTTVIENNHYFPKSSLITKFFKSSSHTSACFWKGEAEYLSVEVEGEINKNAAWYYPEPKVKAESIKGKVAFWKGVTVEE